MFFGKGMNDHDLKSVRKNIKLHFVLTSFKAKC